MDFYCRGKARRRKEDEDHLRIGPIFPGERGPTKHLAGAYPLDVLTFRMNLPGLAGSSTETARFPAIGYLPSREAICFKGAEPQSGVGA